MFRKRSRKTSFHQRLTHMEQALDRLDEAISDLAVKRNAIRQEKIIEEIETILTSRLSALPASIRSGIMARLSYENLTN